MSSNPHQSGSPHQQQPLQWQAPVALQPASGDAEPGVAGLYAGDAETSGLHPTEQAADGPGLVSEIVLTAIVALGVTMATCSALYFAGAFSTPSHHAAPPVPSAR